MLQATLWQGLLVMRQTRAFRCLLVVVSVVVRLWRPRLVQMELMGPPGEPTTMVPACLATVVVMVLMLTRKAPVLVTILM